MLKTAKDRAPERDLRPLLRAKGFRISEVARAVGYTEVHIHRVISGCQRPSERLAHELETATGIPWRTWRWVEDAAA